MSTYCTLETVPVEVTEEKTKLKIIRSKIQNTFDRLFLNMFSKSRSEKENLVFDGSDLVIVFKEDDELIRSKGNGVICLNEISSEARERLVSAARVDEKEEESSHLPNYFADKK